jgi:uncharacterized protein (TIGR03382 family)
MRRIAFALAMLTPAAASAHIRITSPTPRSSDQLKQRHCGQTGSARANVQTYQAGSVLHLVWDEYVVHPGWFRISFQQNGDTFEVPPASNGPAGSGAASNYPTEDLTGKTDPATGSLIIADRIMHGMSSFDVTLPNVACSNCTLQLTQMMTDKPPYAADTTSDDIYYQCVDLVLTASAPPVDAGTGGGTGGTGVDAGTGGDGTGGTGAVSGGCNSSGGAPGLLLVAALGLVRRRRAGRE